MISGGHAAVFRWLPQASFAEADESGPSAAQPPSKIFRERHIAKACPIRNCIRKLSLLSHPTCGIWINAFRPNHSSKTCSVSKER